MIYTQTRTLSKRKRAVKMAMKTACLTGNKGIPAAEFCAGGVLLGQVRINAGRYPVRSVSEAAQCPLSGLYAAMAEVGAVWSGSGFWATYDGS